MSDLTDFILLTREKTFENMILLLRFSNLFFTRNKTSIWNQVWKTYSIQKFIKNTLERVKLNSQISPDFVSGVGYISVQRNNSSCRCDEKIESMKKKFCESFEAMQFGWQFFVGFCQCVSFNAIKHFTKNINTSHDASQIDINYGHYIKANCANVGAPVNMKNSIIRDWKLFKCILDFTISKREKAKVCSAWRRKKNEDKIMAWIAGKSFTWKLIL